MTSLLFFVVIFYSTTYSAKIDEIRDITVHTSTWEPTPEQFSQYIAKGPRDYDVLAFFTSDNDSWCQSCSVIQEEFKKVADWYFVSTSKDNKDLFFTLTEWDRHKPIYLSYREKIYTMPSVILLPRTDKKGTQFTITEKDRFVLKPDFSAESLAEFINTRLGKVKVRAPEYSMTNVYVLLGLMLFVVGSITYHNFRKVAFWTTIALLFPWFTYTGTYFNLSHRPPLVYPQGKSYIIFWPSQQMQTVSEGLILASLIVFMGVVFALFFTYVPTVRYKFRRLIFYPLLCLMGSLLYIYWNIWKIKSPWYLTYSQ